MMKELNKNEKFFLFLVEKGMREKGFWGQPDYMQRANLEVSRIINKNFTKYILIVWDFTKWAKENGILTGIGRGSAGSSICAYCLGITEVDSVKEKMVFERLISSIRRDYPDFDCDFSDDKRDQVFKYLADTYDKNCVTRINTFSEWHGKGALRDIGRIFDIPRSEYEKICALVIQRSGGDMRCVSGNSIVYCDGKIMKIKEAYLKKPKKIISLKNNKISECNIKNFFYNGKKPVYQLITENNKKIICTENHRFLTKDGWKRLKDLYVEEVILTI